METHELSPEDWTKYQALKGMEETLIKEANAKLEAAKKLGELAASIMNPHSIYRDVL